jgi:hypothetical protein
MTKKTKDEKLKDIKATQQPQPPANQAGKKLFSVEGFSKMTPEEKDRLLDRILDGVEAQENPEEKPAPPTPLKKSRKKQAVKKSKEKSTDKLTEKPVRVDFGRNPTARAILDGIHKMQDEWAKRHPDRAHTLYPNIYDAEGNRIKK